MGDSSTLYNERHWRAFIKWCDGEGCSMNGSVPTEILRKLYEVPMRSPLSSSPSSSPTSSPPSSPSPSPSSSTVSPAERILSEADNEWAAIMTPKSPI